MAVIYHYLPSELILRQTVSLRTFLTTSARVLSGGNPAVCVVRVCGSTGFTVPSLMVRVVERLVLALTFKAGLHRVSGLGPSKCFKQKKHWLKLIWKIENRCYILWDNNALLWWRIIVLADRHHDNNASLLLALGAPLGFSIGPNKKFRHPFKESVQMQNYERVFPHLDAVASSHAHFGFIYPFTEISIAEISASTLT